MSDPRASRWPTIQATEWSAEPPPPPCTVGWLGAPAPVVLACVTALLATRISARQRPARSPAAR